MAKKFTFDKIVESEKLPIPKIQESPVLDAFARALNNALDESSDRRPASCRVRKNKAWKCPIKSKTGPTNLGSSLIKCTSKSDSETSLDNWVNQQMEITRKVYNQCTDSDDVNKTYRQFAEWRQCADNIGESDSVTESAQRSREPRRKRKFKRMAIDSPVVTNRNFSQKHKRNRNQKLVRSSKMPAKYSKLAKVPILHASGKIKCRANFKPVGTTCGKRKRCNEERNSECSEILNVYGCKESIFDRYIFDSNFSFPGCSNSVEFIASELSSSDSELSAEEDESREADDEQSDFYCDSGSSHSVLNSEDEDYDETAGYCQLMEMRFDVIPAFRELYENRRKHMYDTLMKKIEENGGDVKSGQRRLKKAYQSSFSKNEFCEKLRKDEYNEFSLLAEEFSLLADSYFTKISPNEKKKRKG